MFFPMKKAIGLKTRKIMPRTIFNNWITNGSSQMVRNMHSQMGQFCLILLSSVEPPKLFTIDSGYSRSTYSHTLDIITMPLLPKFNSGQNLINAFC